MGNNAHWFNSSNGYLLSNSSTAPRGSLAMIGGRFESDNEKLFQALKDRCDGIAVLSMASGYPEEVGSELVEDFQRYGFETELLPLFWENRETSAFDPDIIQRLQHYGSVFFSGGNQARIVETLVQGGVETPALACIRRCRARNNRLLIALSVVSNVRPHDSRRHLAQCRGQRVEQRPG